VWSWWRSGSVHRAAWPTPAELEAAAGAGADVQYYVEAQQATAEIRRQKAVQKLKMKDRVDVVVEGESARLSLLRMLESELAAANSAQLTWKPGAALQFTVTPVPVTDATPETRA
jgi:valyl-tRNA synthetase